MFFQECNQSASLALLDPVHSRQNNPKVHTAAIAGSRLWNSELSLYATLGVVSSKRPARHVEFAGDKLSQAR